MTSGVLVSFGQALTVTGCHFVCVCENVARTVRADTAAELEPLLVLYMSLQSSQKYTL